MNKDKRNVMIVVLLVIVACMSVGYALLSTKTDMTRMTTSMNSGYKDVALTTIVNIETEGNGEDTHSEIDGKTSVILYPLVNDVGDKVVYTFNVKNNGTEASELKSIEITPNQDEHVSYYLDNISAGEKLAAQDSKMFTLTVEYNENYDGEAIDSNATKITLNLDYEK